MARPAQLPTLTPGQAQYVLNQLIADGTVKAADVRRHAASIQEEIGTLERRLAELRAAASGVHPVRAAKRAARSVAKKVRQLSAKTKASYQVQGQYLGYIRQIPKTQRAKYQRLAKEQGREKAIAALKKALGKS